MPRCVSKQKDLAKIEVENGNKARVPKTAFIPPGHFNPAALDPMDGQREWNCSAKLQGYLGINA